MLEFQDFQGRLGFNFKLQYNLPNTVPEIDECLFLPCLSHIWIFFYMAILKTTFVPERTMSKDYYYYYYNYGIVFSTFPLFVKYCNTGHDDQPQQGSVLNMN